MVKLDVTCFPGPQLRGKSQSHNTVFLCPPPVLCWTPGPTESSSSFGSPQGVCGVLSPWPSPLLPGAATGLSPLWLVHLLLLLTSKAAALPVLSSRSLGCRRAAPTPVMSVLTVPPPVRHSLLATARAPSGVLARGFGVSPSPGKLLEGPTLKFQQCPS